MTTAEITPANNELAKALIAFQADLPKVELDATNPHFKSKYTSLTELTDKALPALSKHDLAFTATPQVTESGFVLEAHLIHASGASLTASFPIAETNPQKVGSAITYYRRYALASMTGIVADLDDDGNAASAGPTVAEQKIANARSAAPRKAASRYHEQGPRHYPRRVHRGRYRLQGHR